MPKRLALPKGTAGIEMPKRSIECPKRVPKRLALPKGTACIEMPKRSKRHALMDVDLRGACQQPACK